MKSPETLALAGLAPSRASGVLAFLLLASTVSCAYRVPVRSRVISSYRGDGTISKIHFILNPGVLIEFEKFPLSQPYHAKYRLKGLPVRPTHYDVELVVDSPGPALDPHRPRGGQYGLPGVLHLRLVDQWEFAQREGSLFDYTWSPEDDGWSSESGIGRDGSHYIHAVASRLGTIIEPVAAHLASEGICTLEISWEPGENVPAKQAWVRMSSGGYL